MASFEMEIIVIGLNHKTAPVELRERLAFSKAKLEEAYSLIRKYPSIHESLILSTCNRVEIYAVTDDLAQGISELKEFLSGYKKIGLSDFEENLYVYFQPESIQHIFNVASGLDSMVIGETQILGQVKEAYMDACRNNAIGVVLDKLLQATFQTAKQVRNSTGITKGAVSISSVAVRLAEEKLGSLYGRKVMVIGAGKISGLAVKYLVSKGCSSILVSNRTYEKAKELAMEFRGKAIRFDRLLDFMLDVDIVISSTSAPHIVIKKKDIFLLLEKRKNRPLFFIDLAVPRDIEPGIGEIEGAHLYDIDDLKKIAEKNILLRREEIDDCEEIIKNNVNRFNGKQEAVIDFIHSF